jgi:DNA repair protein RecO (recombination protein O)
MDRFKERAVVLGTLDYGEADRLVTLFTEGRGRLTAFAAGARKSKRRFAGALEPATLLSVQLAERRGTTFRMDSADIEHSFLRIREDLPRIARGLYCLELCRELLREQEPHPQLFERLVEYLRRLEGAEAGPTSLLAFELEALAQAGFQPRFDSCALCGKPVEGERGRFDAEHGGAICADCEGRVPHAERVPGEVMRALASLQQGHRQPLPAHVRARSRQLLNTFIAHQLGRRLKSVEFMAQLGVD